MQFRKMMLLDFLGQIAWIRKDFLSQGKIPDIFIRCARNRGSYMKAHVLLNILNELGKRDKMRGLPSILSLFRNKLHECSYFIEFIKQVGEKR